MQRDLGRADGPGLPFAPRTESAAPAEAKLVRATLEARVVADVPERFVGDNAYERDRWDEQLRQDYGAEMIAPNRVNRLTPTQNGRPLRRHRRWWKIQRLFAWRSSFRRLGARSENHAENFPGFVPLAAALILLRH